MAKASGDGGDLKSWISKQPKDRHPKLRSARRELCRVYEDKVTGIFWWYRVGEQAATFFPGKSRMYRSGLMGLLARELGADEDNAVKRAANTLWQARAIATTLTPSEARAWARKRNRLGQPLSAHHVHCLVGVEDPDQRNELLDQCLAGSWGVRRLRTEVQKLNGRMKSGGGRRPGPRAVPTPLAALQEIRLAATHWTANHDVWFARADAALRRTPKAEPRGRLSEDIQRAIEALASVHANITQELTRLDEFAARLNDGPARSARSPKTNVKTAKPKRKPVVPKKAKKRPGR